MAHRIFDFHRDRRRKARSAQRPWRRPHRRRDDGLSMRWAWGAIAAAALVLVTVSGQFGLDRLTAGWLTAGPQPSGLVGLAPATPRTAFAARAMPICGGGRRIDCVVDGDTFWIDGEKVRIESIDAPEVKGRCAGESALAGRATRRLAELLSNRPIEMTRNGADRFGRTLARVRTQGRDVGALLVSEGLARPWDGRKAEWCAA